MQRPQHRQRITGRAPVAGGHTGSSTSRGSSPHSHACTRSARRANRRSHSRTVVYGTPSSAATRFHGRPRAAASNPAQITSTPYCLRRSIESGSSTRDTPHPAHSARRGRTRPVTPPSPTRSGEPRAFRTADLQ